MNETDKQGAGAAEAPVLDAKSGPPVILKQNAEQIYAQIKTYQANADKSLAQVAADIERVKAQLQDLNRISLMLNGQKQLLADQLDKMVQQDSTPK